jgi:hypothetical protein
VRLLAIILLRLLSVAAALVAAVPLGWAVYVYVVAVLPDSDCGPSGAGCGLGPAVLGILAAAPPAALAAGLWALARKL